MPPSPPPATRGRPMTSAPPPAGRGRALDALRVRYCGRKGGIVPALFAKLKSVSPDQKREVGDALNKLRDRLESELKEKSDAVQAAEEARRQARETIDVTLPSRLPRLGHLHPTTIARLEIEQLFREMAYTIDPGPEIDGVRHLAEE